MTTALAQAFAMIFKKIFDVAIRFPLSARP